MMELCDEEEWHGEAYEAESVRAARELFGLNYLFPYQRLVIENILEAAAASDSDVNDGRCDHDGCDHDRCDHDRLCYGRQIVILPTGAGKSLCFQLPAALLPGSTLVIYPILSLMADQERRLAERGMTPVVLRGGQSDEEREAIFTRVASGEVKFIIANPEVLLTEKMLHSLPRLGIIHTVIDEAHCVSEWGESFRPSYLEINRIIAAAQSPLVTAFTATASAPVLEKIDRYIFGAGNNNCPSAGCAHRIIGNPDRANVKYAATGTLLPDLAVAELLKECEKPAIVFCSSRGGTEKLARRLRVALGSSEVRFYHAGLEREEKDAAEKWFFASGDGVLVATCAYGMGVDKPNIRTVIHRDCPPSVEAYLQESGRAGRDGKPSRAFLLWGPDDDAALRRAATDYDKARLGELFRYARDAGNCRRETLLRLLNYEGDGAAEPGFCCDICDAREKLSLRDTSHRDSISLSDGISLRDITFGHREEAAALAFFRRHARSFTEGEAHRELARQSGWNHGEIRVLIGALLRDKKIAKSRNPLFKGRLYVK